MNAVTHTPGDLSVSEFDGVTLYARNHLGVAACGPDPMCREHYVGGPVGGNYFAPANDLMVRKANAERLCRAWNAHDDLVTSCIELARAVKLMKELAPALARQHQVSDGLLVRANMALRKADVISC